MCIQVLAMSLVNTASHWWLLAHSSPRVAPKPAIVDGILQFLEMVQWGRVSSGTVMFNATSLLDTCCRAANSGGLDGTCFLGQEVYHNIICRVLDTYGAGPSNECLLRQQTHLHGFLLALSCGQRHSGARLQLRDASWTPHLAAPCYLPSVGARACQQSCVVPKGS
jgi:hypothetical protein